MPDRSRTQRLATRAARARPSPFNRHQLRPYRRRIDWHTARTLYAQKTAATRSQIAAATGWAAMPATAARRRQPGVVARRRIGAATVDVALVVSPRVPPGAQAALPKAAPRLNACLG